MSIAKMLPEAFGIEYPRTSPKTSGPFIGAVQFISGRMIEAVEGNAKSKTTGKAVTIDSDLEAEAVRCLRQFTAQAAASLWYRRHKLKKSAKPTARKPL